MIRSSIVVALLGLVLACGRTSLLDDWPASTNPDAKVNDVSGSHDAARSAIEDAGAPGEAFDASDASLGIDGGQTSDSSLDAEDSDQWASGGDSGSDASVDAGELAPCLVGGNVAFVDGDPGDYIHPGLETITQGVWGPRPYPNNFGFSIDPPPATVESWWFSFGHLDEPLAVGEYEATEHLYSGHASLRVSVGTRECTTIQGKFRIVDLQFGHHSFRSFSATFEQHCNGSPAVLRGCIHFEGD